MTVERKIEYDPSKNEVKVMQTTVEWFALDRIDQIISSLEGQLKQAEGSLRMAEELKGAFKLMENRHVNNSVKVVFSILRQRLPDEKNVDAEIKYWKEQIPIIKRDIEFFRSDSMKKAIETVKLEMEKNKQ